MQPSPEARRERTGVLQSDLTRNSGPDISRAWCPERGTLTLGDTYFFALGAVLCLVECLAVAWVSTH